MNTDTRKAYKTMFCEMFRILGDVARSPIRFPHIHGGEQGIRTVTVDMCRKQAPGINNLPLAHAILSICAKYIQGSGTISIR